MDEISLNEYDVVEFAKNYINNILNSDSSLKIIKSNLKELTRNFYEKFESELADIEIYHERKDEKTTEIDVTDCKLKAYAIKKAYLATQYDVIVEAHDITSGLKWVETNI